MKTINGRYINRYLAKVGKHIRRIVSEIPLKIVDKYMEQEKREIQENVAKNNLTIE
jgi:phage terminase Nu1 subunit (DNA packaging protein)